MLSIILWCNAFLSPRIFKFYTYWDFFRPIRQIILYLWYILKRKIHISDLSVLNPFLCLELLISHCPPHNIVLHTLVNQNFFGESVFLKALVNGPLIKEIPVVWNWTTFDFTTSAAPSYTIWHLRVRCECSSVDFWIFKSLTPILCKFWC